MNVKFQIFVSSTYEDLKSERDQVVRAILEMGHIPVGMEMFSAADEQQWKLIARQIEVSDYYVVIVAHRYGSLDGKVSFTEKEYDYAIKCGVPTLGFILQDGAPWPGNKVDKDRSKVKSLNAFREKIKQKLIGFWSSGDDLHGKVSIALMKQMVASPREGWVRASGAASPQILSELARLSQENGDLRLQLNQATAQANSDQREDRDKIVGALRANRMPISIWYEGDSTWNTDAKKTLYDIFYLLAPELIIEKSIEATSAFVGRMWQSQDRKTRAAWPVPSNLVKTWFADLASLGLTQPSAKKHPTSDTNEYWTLTDSGRQVYSQLRRARLEAGISTEPVTKKK